MRLVRINPVLIATVVVVVLLVWGCTAGRRADTVMADVNPFGWLNEQTVVYDNADTLSKTDIALVVRCNADTDLRNLPLTLTFMAPDSSRFVERRVFPLELPEKRTSTAVVVTVPYRRSVRLSQCGEYTITLKPTVAVHGIEAAGFTFQKND